MQFICGIDEAGRGPLAGPVAVGVVYTPVGFNFTEAFPGLADSKKLSAKKREEIFEALARHSVVRYAVSFESAEQIDTRGIVPSVTRALESALAVLAPDPKDTRVFLDGGLRAPESFLFQETIIKGDTLVPIISLASVAAKVLRDRHMEEIAKRYSAYGFEKHKGYGTKAHLALIKTHGLSPIHRRSFIHL